MKCHKCSSTATHFPRIVVRGFSGRQQYLAMGMVLRIPTCTEHQSPFLVEVLKSASQSPLSNLWGEIEEKFERFHGFRPNFLDSSHEYVSIDAPKIRELIQAWDGHREKQPLEMRPKSVQIEHVSYPEFREIMASAPDVAIKPS